MPSLRSSARLGTASVSSLIRSASSLQTTLNTYHDTVARLTYENSARTDGDLQAYQNYLNGRVTNLEATGTIGDATKALNMRQEIVSATKSNMSFNIQRSTIAVLDGHGTPDQKLEVIGNAFQKLYALGDLAAATQYEGQYYSYYQTVQLQKAQAAEALAKASGSGGGGGGGGSSGYTSVVNAAEGAIKSNIQNANAAFAAQGPKFLDQQTNGYLKNNVDKTGAHVNGSASIFAALAGQVGMVNKGIQLNGTTKYQQGTYTAGSMLDIYTQALALDPSHAASYQSKIDGYLNNATGIPLPGEGNKSITYNALMNTVYAGNSGNAPYGLMKGADGSWQVQAEHISGYTYGKDMNGATKLMPSYSFFDAGVPKGTADALKKAGINVKGDSNGDYWFQAASGGGSWLAKAVGNYPTQGAVQKDGSVELVGQDGNLYKMVKGTNGLYGLQEINQFGQIVNPNVAGQYGFKPPQSGVLVNKGSMDFMSKVLGDTATPQVSGNKVLYSANGKTYQLVADTKGLHALQEIDPKTGKILNNNVAGQYGFNPTSVSRSLPSSDPNNPNSPYKGGQFMSTLLANHEKYASGLNNAGNPNFHLPGSLYGSTPQWLGVSQLIQNAQMIQTINAAHNTAMLALAAPPLLPRLTVAPPPPAPHPAQALRVAPPAPQPRLNVAASHPTAASVQQATPVHIQGSSPQLQGGNVNLQGGGGFSLQGGGGIRLQ